MKVITEVKTVVTCMNSIRIPVMKPGTLVRFHNTDGTESALDSQTFDTEYLQRVDVSRANKRADIAMRNSAYFKGQMQTARDERKKLTGASFWTRLWWLFDGVSLRTPWTL